MYTFLVSFKLLPPLPARRSQALDVEQGQEEKPAPLPIEETIFEQTASDQKRRKELAQKALEARLLEKTSGSK